MTDSPQPRSHEFFMRRALQLAANARGFTSPNPMVGCVIVARGCVIGEGYHRRCGGPHAEVWAVRSVPNSLRDLLPEATVYVTLEPCSHDGKTPPCADMLVAERVGAVVVGSLDPNPSVSGRGINRLRDAGIPVTVGVLESECRELNRHFLVRQELHRPYILLKWAQSADGFLDRRRDVSQAPCAFSTPLSRQLMHSLRACFDAIMVGAATVMADDPALTVRDYSGRHPRPVIVDRCGLVPPSARVFSTPGAIYLSATARTDLPPEVEQIIIPSDASPRCIIEALASLSVSSVMIEGGPTLLRSFINASLWDDARIEMAHFSLETAGIAHMDIPAGIIDIKPAPDGQNSIINVKNASPMAF